MGRLIWVFNGRTSLIIDIALHWLRHKIYLYRYSQYLVIWVSTLITWYKTGFEYCCLFTKLPHNKSCPFGIFKLQSKLGMWHCMQTARPQIEDVSIYFSYFSTKNIPFGYSLEAPHGEIKKIKILVFSGWKNTKQNISYLNFATEFRFCNLKNRSGQTHSYMRKDRFCQNEAQLFQNMS